ncbi:hypothetical protein GCM10009092_02130 [Bowmanella denitrificans]|uniref:Uncharacterized protein YyaB-like PH domain-containing protein n=1 Tax=Bowmanella denitrificans TaxID=366582 RepID=A0ABP3GCW4_9ALTE
MNQTYSSKVDILFALILIFSLFISLRGLSSLGLSLQLNQSFIPKIVLLLFGIILPLSILFFTNYKVEGEQLIVRSSIFKWNIPINSIEKIEKEKNLVASPALSIELISIKAKDKHILISPKEEDEFIKNLISINEKIVVK